jgi:excisionase family DNA binding protein
MLRAPLRLRLSPSEAAAFADVSARTIRRALAAGEFPAVYLNARVVRIARPDLEAWIARRTRTAGRNS